MCVGRGETQGGDTCGVLMRWPVYGDEGTGRLGGRLGSVWVGQVSTSHNSSQLELTMVDSMKSSSWSCADPIVSA